MSDKNLVMRPDVDQHETRMRTSAGVDIRIRSIRPDDAPLLVELFESLSPRSVYMRFFSPLKHLPQKMLARFTQIDYDREIALVALPDSVARERLLAVARVITNKHNSKEAEFAIAVGDPWQGKGIGASLLHRCLMLARERDIHRVNGVVLAENVQMLILGRKLGFRIKALPGGGEFELSLDIANN